MPPRSNCRTVFRAIRALDSKIDRAERDAEFATMQKANRFGEAAILTGQSESDVVDAYDTWLCEVETAEAAAIADAVNADAKRDLDI